MISVLQYFLDPQTGAQKPHLPEHTQQATNLLAKVNALLAHLAWEYPIDLDTQTSISGVKGGHGGGGFRLMGEAGAVRSMHKRAHAVDVYDPRDELDKLLTDALLEQFGLYRENPADTPGWVHLQDLPPASGHRTFNP